MIRGEKVGLRARAETDVPILHTELYEDVATAVRADGRAWRPLAVSASLFAIGQESDTTAAFSVVELASGELAGEASLWGVDLFNRSAHLGLALRPGFRGRGLAIDAVRVLSFYGFAIRGLHRLQVETLADNHPMRRAAERCGFVLEGTRRHASWVSGEFVDEVLLGLLAPEWQRPESPKPESPKPESPKPESPRPESPRPESPRPESPRPESVRPESLRPESPKQESLRPESPKPEWPRPKPESLRPESESPRVAEP